MNEAPPLIESRDGFHAALAWGFEQAIELGARQIVCADPDFADWAWDDASRLSMLSVWLRQPQRRLILLARRYEAMPRRWPRYCTWRRDWAHAISAWQPPVDWNVEIPCLLVADRGVSVHLIDATHWRGRASLETRTAHLWRERIDAVLQRSEAAFAVGTLGL